MVTEHWPRGTQVTRLYERDSLALSLTRSSGETRAHRSPSARPAILTVRRLLYSNGFLPPFSSAEFCSAYQSLSVHYNRQKQYNSIHHLFPMSGLLSSSCCLVSLNISICLSGRLSRLPNCTSTSLQ